ncbi:MAG: hypothetical protein KIS85_06305 [Anaerolineales bacterium]|nr:hypothetical protein [Anaerolineales bacterium]
MAERVRAIRPIELPDGRTLLPGSWLDEQPADQVDAWVEAGLAARVVRGGKPAKASRKGLGLRREEED